MRYSTVRLMHNKKLPLLYDCAGDAIRGEQLSSRLPTLTPPAATEEVKNICLEYESIFLCSCCCCWSLVYVHLPKTLFMVCLSWCLVFNGVQCPVCSDRWFGCETGPYGVWWDSLGRWDTLIRSFHTPKYTRRQIQIERQIQIRGHTEPGTALGGETLHYSHTLRYPKDAVHIQRHIQIRGHQEKRFPGTP